MTSHPIELEIPRHGCLVAKSGFDGASVCIHLVIVPVRIAHDAQKYKVLFSFGREHVRPMSDAAGR